MKTSIPNVFASFLLFYLCLLAGIVQAQETKSYDVIYLKDSTMIYGQIMRYEPEGNLLIQLDNGRTIAYPADQVAKTKREEARVKFANAANKKNRIIHPLDFVLKNRFYGWGAVGNTFWGQDPNTIVGLTVDVGIGYQFHRLLVLGAGAGLMTEWRQSTAFVYGSLRGALLKSSFSPFYQVDVGYGAPLGRNPYLVLVTPEAPGFAITKREGGLYVHPSVGFRFSSKRVVHTYLALGCMIQYIRYEGIDWNNFEFAEKVMFVRPTIRAGMMF